MRAPSHLATSKLHVVLALALGLAGCGPEIGDECTTSTDCSQTGDRLCDTSQPGGYCTIFNCEPSGANPVAKCPDEAACVAFAVEPSPVTGCANELGATPYTKSFCLKKCDNSDDCRAGYTCENVQSALDENGHKRFSAADLDGQSKVCVVAFSSPAPDPEDASSQVCSAPGRGDEGAAGASSEDGGGGAGGNSQ